MGKPRASPAPAFLADNEDLLLEILLRLLPLLSLLPRASLRRLLSDPQFLRRFRAYHRKRPMLGFFSVDFHNEDGPIPVFAPTLAAPDHIPPMRFFFPNHPCEVLFFFGCHHGLALLFNRRKLEAVVWDPITHL
uniref:F-box domain-containing protein n=1 Tax=Setaria italica TaxID=4555 RepID=K3ZC10_SETIT